MFQSPPTRYIIHIIINEWLILYIDAECHTKNGANHQPDQQSWEHWQRGKPTAKTLPPFILNTPQTKLWWMWGISTFCWDHRNGVFHMNG